MSEEVQRLVGKVVLDTAQAARSARDFAKEQDRLRAGMAALAKEEARVVAEAARLRAATRNVQQAEISGTQSRRELTLQTKIIRHEQAKLAEVTRSVRDEQRKLRDEEKALQAELRNTARVAQEARRAEVAAAREAARQEAQIGRDREAAARARRRSEGLAVRGRGLHAQDITSARSINARETAIAESQARLFRLTGRPLGGIRTRVEDAVGRGVERFRSGEGFGEAVGKLGSGTRQLAGAVGGAVLTGGIAIGGAAAGIASVGSEFEKLRASLETIEGSKAKAEATFASIQEFARTTPYGLQETTTALVKLKARGLDSSLPSLRAYGDTASAMGKSLDEMIEAVADAATGEFERLKEFGIKASTQGDQIKLTFKGTTTTVKKDAKEIEQYLIQLGKANFAGGMERQAQTLGGQLSGLGDAVAQLADEAFRSGLGDAIKEVVADMSGMAGEGSDLAKVIGKSLGDAVRGAWKWLKELIGPVDQLDDKFKAAWEKGEKFAGVLASVATTVVDLVSKLDGGTLAIGAMGVALVALTGPLGAVIALGATLGATLVSAFSDSNEELRKLQNTAHEIRQQEYRDKLDAIERAHDQSIRWSEQSRRASEAGNRVREIELRRLGKTGDQLTPAEMQAIERKAAGVERGLLGKGPSGGRAFGGGDFESRMSAFDASAKDLEHDADLAEFGRLKARRKHLSPSEKKRLGELGKSLDLNTTPGPKGPKEKLDAFSAARKKEIDDLVKQAELDAADRALASGNAGGAGAAAKTAGKEARDRLEAMAAKGALPGEVERSLLRQAGFSDVANAPPPPVIVYQQTFNLDVVLEMAQTITSRGDPVQAAQDVGQASRTYFERDLLPIVADMFRGAIRR